LSEVPDSATDTRPGKRERLVASAGELLHRHGADGPTLAEIAQAADVPPGNVYYYFKTRDDLVRAVIAARADEVRALLASLESRSTPRLRLKGMARSWTDMTELVVAFGCPIGTLTADLSRRDDGLGSEAAGLIELMLDWATGQFRAMGRRDARELATTLVAGIQGAAVLANALQDPKLLTRETRRLERWIDELDQAANVRSSSANSSR
jgi:TetR/AcrR family transcriptional repressor of nem operon